MGAAASLTLLLSDVETIRELGVYTLIMNLTPCKTQTAEGVVVPTYYQLPDDNQVVKPVIMPHNNKVLDLMRRCSPLICIDPIVMALNVHSLYSRAYFNFVIMAIDSEIFDVVTDPLVTVVLINGIGILLRLRGRSVRRLMSSVRRLTMTSVSVVVGGS